jgi:DNA-binding NtrC family response regulator
MIDSLELCGTSPAMQRLYKLIRHVSQHRHTVLIVGESGSGKEMVARAIHKLGPLSRRPFLPVDCSSLSPTLIESELFGHVRGAFTGAVVSKMGLLEAAGSGTVLLDEIAEMPLSLQVKLLRTLQEREVRPVGGNSGVKIAARILAATNRDLTAAVRQGAFRADLYFRLNVVTLTVPPLRRRKSDIPLLVNHFLSKHHTPGVDRITVSEEALRLLAEHDWPGNVRELENCIERALALGAGPVLDWTDVADLQQRSYSLPEPSPPALSSGSNGHSPMNGMAHKLTIRPETTDWNAPVPGSFFYRNGQTIPLAEVEKQAILHAVAVSRGDKILAARLLGIGKTTVYRKLKEYGVPV